MMKYRTQHLQNIINTMSLIWLAAKLFIPNLIICIYTIISNLYEFIIIDGIINTINEPKRIVGEIYGS